MIQQLAEIELLPIPSDPRLRLLFGILAALGSTGCWVFTSLAFTIAGRRYGSTTVNVTRSVIATVVLLLLVRALGSSWFPIYDTEQILWLVLSGIAGLAIGDQLLFSAFNRVGPRRTLLVLNLAPVFTALLAWPILGETLVPFAWLGMAITVLGIAWVISESSQRSHQAASADPLLMPRLGLLLALIGTIAISIGNAFAKLGMVGDEEKTHVDPLIAQDVRMLAGAGAILLLASMAGILGRRIGSPPTPDEASRPRRKTAVILLLLGTLFGPLLGIWFFLVSAAFVKLAIATTILALTPVAILPFSHVAERSPITQRAILGALVAVIGVAVLSFAEYRPESTEATSPGNVGSAPETLDFQE